MTFGGRALIGWLGHSGFGASSGVISGCLLGAVGPHTCSLGCSLLQVEWLWLSSLAVLAKKHWGVASCADTRAAN